MVEFFFFQWGEINAVVLKQKKKRGTALIDYKTKQGAVSEEYLSTFSGVWDFCSLMFVVVVIQAQFRNFSETGSFFSIHS